MENAFNKSFEKSSFTIQNVSIKLNRTAIVDYRVKNLQYKMFLLNFNNSINLSGIIIFTIQNVSIKFCF